MDAIVTHLNFELQIVQQYAKELGYSFATRHQRRPTFERVNDVPVRTSPSPDELSEYKHHSSSPKIPYKSINSIYTSQL